MAMLGDMTVACPKKVTLVQGIHTHVIGQQQILRTAVVNSGTARHIMAVAHVKRCPEMNSNVPIILSSALAPGPSKISKVTAVAISVTSRQSYQAKQFALKMLDISAQKILTSNMLMGKILLPNASVIGGMNRLAKEVASQKKSSNALIIPMSNFKKEQTSNQNVNAIGIM